MIRGLGFGGWRRGRCVSRTHHLKDDEQRDGGKLELVCRTIGEEKLSPDSPRLPLNLLIRCRPSGAANCGPVGLPPPGGGLLHVRLAAKRLGFANSG
jgi:hypothetical protein